MSLADSARPLVAAIIPTRNRARILARAIESVLGQEGRGAEFDVEITVVDDASSDDTPDVVRRYPGIRYVRLEQQRGAAAARNVGLRASAGRYVAFQDDDDEWLPHKLRVQTSALRRHPDVGVVYSQSLVRNAIHEFLWPRASEAPSGWVFRPLLLTCFCAHPPGLLIRRNVVATVGGFDEELRTNEDYDLWLRIAFHFPFLFVPGAVAVYNESAEGLYYSTMARGGGARDARMVIERALRMLPAGGRHDAIRREVRLRTELHIAQHGAWFAGREARWRAALGAVRAHPEIMRYRWARGAIAMEGARQIADARAPIAAGRQVCRQLAQAAAGRGVRQRLWLRLTLASVWTEASQNLHRGSSRSAGAAAARAVAYDLSKLRKKTLLMSIARWLFLPFAGALFRFLQRHSEAMRM